MKRFFLSIFILAVLMSCFAGCAEDKTSEVIIIPIPVEDSLAMIDDCFAKGDLDGVKAIYEEATGKDYRTIEDYIISYAYLYVDVAKQELSTKALKEFYRTGYSGSVISEGIALVERLIVSEAAYKEGKIAFNGRDFDASKEKLNAVDPEYTNFDVAQQCLSEIAVREQAWQSSDYGRNQGSYGLAIDDEFVYMAYKHEGIYGILKADLAGEYTEFIPLSDAADYVITGINLVGDYLYFIAGENVGRGLMLDNPYCIYEMKTDGSGLALAAQGDYFDMAIHNKEVYVLSYTKGLIRMDENFDEQEVLSTNRVIELCVASEGVYYTVQGSLESKSVNTVYLYDGKSHQEVLSDSFAHYYIYEQNALRLTSTRSNKEKLVLETRGEEKQIASTDILEVYGLISDQVIYSIPGDYGQERLYGYNLETSKSKSYANSKDLPEFYIEGICYETNSIYAVNTDGICVMQPDLTNYKALDIGEVDIEKLSANKALLRHTGDAELYSPGEEVIVILSDEQLWHYNDANFNITMEKRYVEETECTAYVTHIYTNDFEQITTDSWGEAEDSRSTAKPEDIAKKFGIIFGQSTDFFSYDSRKGIVIRKGEIFSDHVQNSMLAIYPDGTFVTYEKDDNVSVDKLIKEGVNTTLASGPVLVRDGVLSKSSLGNNPAVRSSRSAIGMVEPGHYVSIVVEGRSSESRGLTTVALGELFADEGCKVAYNLEGNKASLTFLDNTVYVCNKNHKIPDMLHFGTLEIIPMNLEEYTTTLNQYKSTSNEAQ